jgi:DNA-directed RNA polymerase subunit RPC12/RpoP
MPIRFRCGYCNKLLGIARRKAGTETTCPHCGYTITVPEDDGEVETGEGPGGSGEAEDLDALINGSAFAEAPEPPVRTSYPPAAPARPARPVAASPRPAPAPRPAAAADRPLFEQNVEDVLGSTSRPSPADTGKPRPAPTSGMDALSLEAASGQIVLSTQKATLLAVSVVVLLALSFAAGFLVASVK